MQPAVATVIEQFVKQKRAPIFHRLQKETETISVSIMDSFVVDNQTHNSDWRERRITRGGVFDLYDVG